MKEIIRNLLRLVLFLFIEVFVLHKMPHLHRFISPSLYFLFLFWLPFSISPRFLLWIGLITGLLIDYFLQSPGLHASACLWLCFLSRSLFSCLLRSLLRSLLCCLLLCRCLFGCLLSCLTLCWGLLSGLLALLCCHDFLLV